MAIEVVGFESGWSDTDSVVINKPAGTEEGDLMVACFSSPSHPTVPTGWTDIVEGGAFQSRFVRAFCKLAGASEPSSFTFSGSDDIAGGLIVFRGVDPDTPVDVASSFATDSSVTSIAAPSITTTVANAMLVSAAGEDGGSSGILGHPSGMTEAWDVNGSSDPDRAGNALAYQQLGAAGATGTRTWTSPGMAMGVIIFALVPAAAGVWAVGPVLFPR